MSIEFYNGVPYHIECAWVNPWYGRKRLYKIRTEEDNFITAKRAVLSYLNDTNKPSKGQYDLKVQRGDSTFQDYLLGFYTFRFNEAEDCYEYYEEEGYDD